MTQEEFLVFIKKLMSNPEHLKYIKMGYEDSRKQRQKESDCENVNNEIIVENYDKENIIDMKGITKRKDGRYVVRLQKNKIQITKYARTKELAIKLYRQLKGLDFKKSIKQIKQIEKTYTVNEWYEKWLKEYKKGFIAEKVLT